MSPPTPPSPPIISRQSRDEDEYRTSSRSHHRTARDYHATSRSRSRGRHTGGRVASRTPDRANRHRQRSHTKSRSREPSRYQSSARRHRHERSRSKSKGRSDRRRRNSHRSRSRSYSKTTRKSSHKSRSRSGSRTHRRSNRSRSRSKEARASRSQSGRRDERGSSSKQAKVIVLSTESYKDSLKTSSRLPTVREEASNGASSSSAASTSKPSSTHVVTPSWKSVKTEQVGVYSNLDTDEPIDKEKIHKEIEEKLRIALAREGKVYPYPKPEPSHPVFANDGSFLEIFKKMQQQQTFVQQQVGESMQIHAVPAAPIVPTMPAIQPQHPPPPQLPVFGRRRGGKILKTGVVAKPKAQNDGDSGDVKDFWSIYLREVKKYKSTACESDSKTRPLVR